MSDALAVPLEQIRRDRGMSLREFARFINVDPGQYLRVTQGKGVFGRETYDRIVTALPEMSYQHAQAVAAAAREPVA
jgi:transcriptional regulator with XRE-family HTH domain